MKEITIKEDSAGQRLDKFLRRYLPGASVGFLYKMLRKKNIVLNHKKATGKELLAASDVVTIYFAEDTLDKFMTREKTAFPEPDPSWILYEDGGVLIMNKPAGILSQKSKPDDVSMVEYIRGHLKDNDPNLYVPGVANRLDRNTSGIILAGKNLAAARELSELIRKKEIRKDYLALACGTGLRPERLTGYIQKDRDDNLSRVSAALPDGPGAQMIETEIEPLKEFARFGGCTLLRVRLLTGRSHQIRAQMKAIGHPLVGDVKYGRREINEEAARMGIRRQYLHAYRMIFPACGGELAGLSGKTVDAPLPDDLPELP